MLSNQVTQGVGIATKLTEFVVDRSASLSDLVPPSLAVTVSNLPPATTTTTIAVGDTHQQQLQKWSAESSTSTGSISSLEGSC